MTAPDSLDSPALSVRRAADRFHTIGDGLDSWHSFAFGAHHDPSNRHHGLLLANNEDRLAPGAGFDPHPHRDTEIVTWVLSGSLTHRDSAGNTAVARPGTVARMSAGSGLIHSERNDATASGQPCHYVQMWLAPDEFGAAPSYALIDVDPILRSGELVPIASGLAQHGTDAATGLNNRQAGLSVARLSPGGVTTIPDARFVHVFIARGAAVLEGGGLLSAGDSARLTDGGARRLEATSEAEVLVWEMLGNTFA